MAMDGVLVVLVLVLGPVRPVRRECHRWINQYRLQRDTPFAASFKLPLDACLLLNALLDCFSVGRW